MSAPDARRRLRVALVVIAALLATSSCSRPAPPQAVSWLEVRRATAGDANVRVRGTVTRGASDGAIDGAFAADGARARLTVPAFATAGRQATELRIVDQVAYFGRAEVEPTLLQAAGPDALWLRVAGEPRWLARPARVLEIALDPAWRGPFVLLDVLAAGDARATAHETDVIDGTSVRRFAVEPPPALAHRGVRSLDVWIDGSLRLRRVRSVGAAETVEYTLDGVSAPLVVATPPADDTTESAARGRRVEPAAAFVSAAAGEAAGVAWRLLRAPATNGGTCWRFAATPPLRPRGGEEVACSGAPQRGAAPELAVEFPFVAERDGTMDAIVAVAGTLVKSAAVGFADGTSAAPTAVDRAAGIVLWVGAALPVAVALTIDLDDGVSLRCGPGAVTAPADVADLDAADLAEVRTFPWSCIAAD